MEAHHCRSVHIYVAVAVCCTITMFHRFCLFLLFASGTDAVAVVTELDESWQ